MGPTEFRKVLRCIECGETCDDDQNWWCTSEWLPVAMVPGFVVQVHVHYHLRCADTERKWKALSEMGNLAVQSNNLAGQGPN